LRRSDGFVTAVFSIIPLPTSRSGNVSWCTGVLLPLVVSFTLALSCVFFLASRAVLRQHMEETSPKGKERTKDQQQKVAGISPSTKRKKRKQGDVVVYMTFAHPYSRWHVTLVCAERLSMRGYNSFVQAVQ
jgi:hypothetical protein